MAKAGAKNVIAITKSNVDRLSYDGKRLIYWDRDMSAFGVRVGPGNRKSYVVRYRARGGGRRAALKQLTLHGVLSPAQARAKAKEVLVEVANGGDPVDERTRLRNAESVAALFDFYVNDYAVSARLAEGTRKDAALCFRKYATPEIGRLKVEEVRIADIRRLHAKVLAKWGKHQANRTLAFISSAFSRAIENGWCTVNPARGVKKVPTDARERFLSDEEIARLLAALDEYPDQSPANALRLLLYTGARLNEVLKAPWSQFDLARGFWTKPSAHTKQKRMHSFPIGGPALEILCRMREAAPHAVMLFEGASLGYARFDLKRPWRWVKDKARLKGVTIHDLRHTFASCMINHGHSLSVVGRALGHTQAATTMRYAHLYDRTQRDAVTSTGAAIAALADRGNGGKSHVASAPATNH